jgi:hypothetical protein
LDLEEVRVRGDEEGEEEEEMAEAHHKEKVQNNKELHVTFIHDTHNCD